MLILTKMASMINLYDIKENDNMYDSIFLCRNNESIEQI